MVQVGGLGPLMLVGPTPQRAVERYVRGLTRKDVFPGEATTLRRWATHLAPGKEPSRGRRPVIGIQLNAVDQMLGRRVTAAQRVAGHVRRAGGEPVFLPPGYSASKAGALLDRIDHLVLLGGDDVHPSLYGQKVTHARDLNRVRDRYEHRLVIQALTRRLGIDGICRGMQLLNVVAGGTLHQDILLDRATLRPHRTQRGKIVRHQVLLDGKGETARCVGRGCMVVKSLHHQAVKRLGRGLRVTGRSRDGLVEVVESRGGRVRGYQFHPEASRSASSRAIFRGMVRRAAAHGDGRR